MNQSSSAFSHSEQRIMMQEIQSAWIKYENKKIVRHKRMTLGLNTFYLENSLFFQFLNDMLRFPLKSGSGLTWRGRTT